MTSRATRTVVIDDTDREIQYTGEGWFQDNGSQDQIGNFGPIYQGTQHGTFADGTFSYLFSGISVQVFGTNTVVKTPAGTLYQQWECFLDGIRISSTEPFEFAETNWPLCESDFVDGPHNITVKVSVAGLQPFWFDSLQYTPSPSMSLEAATAVQVDNHDSGILFDSGWQALGGSANMTQAAGSTATFNFTGAKVSWVGFIPTELPRGASSATYSIDGGPPTPFKLNGLPPGDTVTMFNQIFFTTPELPAGPHSLFVVHEGTRKQTPLTLDYLYIINTNPTTTPTALPIPSSTPSTTPATPPPRMGSTPTGVIVGGVVGSLALIALALLAFLWLRKRQRRLDSLLEAQAAHDTPVRPASPSNSSFFSPHLSSPARRLSSVLSGYNISTISQTRAMRKHRGMDLQPAHLPALQEKPAMDGGSGY